MRADMCLIIQEGNHGVTNYDQSDMHVETLDHILFI